MLLGLSKRIFRKSRPQLVTEFLTGRVSKFLNKPRIHGRIPKTDEKIERIQELNNDAHRIGHDWLCAGAIRPSDPVPRGDFLGAICMAVGIFMSWAFMIHDGLDEEDGWPDIVRSKEL